MQPGLPSSVCRFVSFNSTKTDPTIRRPSQRAVLIEELVARRKLQCLGMVDNMLSELKKIGVPETLMRYLGDHRLQIEQRDVGWFNVDEIFRFSLNTTLDLKEVRVLLVRRSFQRDGDTCK